MKFENGALINTPLLLLSCVSLAYCGTSSSIIYDLLIVNIFQQKTPPTPHPAPPCWAWMDYSL
jgi:hypothetical protein